MVKTLPTRIGAVVLGLTVAVLMATWKPTPVATAPSREAAANTLASQGKLLCHRNMQTSSWVGAGTQSFFRESDQDPSDTTLCNSLTGGFHYFYSTINAPTVVNSGLNGRVAIQISGGYGDATLNFNNKESELQATSGRWGWRLYRRLGSTFLCKRGKYHQIGQNGFWSSSGTSEPINMQLGPQNVRVRDLNDNQGKWWRIEEYFDRYTSPTSRTMFIKNITTGASESTATASCCPVAGNADASGFWAGNNAGQFKEPIHNYFDRDNDGNGCAAQYMYVLMAKNLGPDERIPPAQEVEGSGGSAPVAGAAPNTPTGLTVR
jgi:hypothetical protein